MLAVVVSQADRASEHIGQRLLELGDWTDYKDDSRPPADGGGTYHRIDGEQPAELRTFTELHIHAEGLAEPFDNPDLLFVVSRHSGETGPLLTAHPTGNSGPADFGGEPGAFARAAPNALVALLASFNEHVPAGYDVGMECTHHGPTDLEIPSLFVELGSGDEQWDDPAGARAVAQAVLDCRAVAPERARQLVGFGGGHYAPRFERICRTTDWAVGHVLADWVLEAMPHPREATAVLERAFEQSGARHAVVEGDRPVLQDVIEELGYEVVSETWTRETAGVPLPTVDRLETALSPVDAGLRFGDPARGYEGDHIVRELPAELTAEAANVDATAARGAVASAALAFETEEGATRPAGRIALAAEEDFATIVEGLAGVLESTYETVRVESEAVVAIRETFDPGTARELGVEPGPAFGQLADGEPVEGDGRQVEPAEVHEREEQRFPVDATR
ncbi:D-aminoacyl-tRNA deacylase [Halosegnis sp.]|uniref:D-aminoacyl-tRNA deacylase n=1 Tax=Halosegnis sp. TaxID=2864959 RepID=UPI0035D4FD9C